MNQRQENILLKEEISEIHTFFQDYGLTWIGSQEKHQRKDLLWNQSSVQQHSIAQDQADKVKIENAGYNLL